MVYGTEEMPLDPRDRRLLKSLSFQVLLYLPLWIAIWFFHPSYKLVVALILGYMVVLKLYGWVRHGKGIRWRKFSKQLIEVWLFVTLIWLLADLLGPWGWIGTALIVLGLALYRIFRTRKLFMAVLWQVARTLWGEDFGKKNNRR